MASVDTPTAPCKKVYVTTEVKQFDLEWTIHDFGQKLCQTTSLYSPFFKVRDVWSGGQDKIVPEVNLTVRLDGNKVDEYNLLNGWITYNITISVEIAGPVKDFLTKMVVAISDASNHREWKRASFPNFLPFTQHGQHTISVKSIDTIPTAALVRLEISFARDLDVTEAMHDAKFVAEMKEFAASEDLADVEVVCGGKTFRAHKFLLAARSDVFKAMFSKKEMREGASGRVVVEDVPADVMETFLAYLAKNEVDWEKGDAGGLLAAADKYHVEGLKEISSNRLAATCDTSNCVEHLVLGHLHDAARVLDAAMGILLKNREAVMGSEEWLAMGRDHPKIFSSLFSTLVNLV
jgi:speckle-type POZ protein